MNKLIMLLLLLPSFCMADEAFMGFGLGVMGDADQHPAQVKLGEFGYRRFMWHGIYWQNKVGYWGEGSDDHTRKGSGYGASGLGLEVKLHPIEIRGGYNLAAITTPDSRLGGRLPQFLGNLGVGFRDWEGDGIGIEYNHISSAGLVMPNHGRDFIVIELSEKW